MVEERGSGAGRRRRWSWLAVAGLVVAVVVIGVALGLARPGERAPATPPPTGAAQPTNPATGASFPAEVSGMPVITVAAADALLRSGGLDGEAVAVAGYFGQGPVPSCPYPGRYIGPLEGWCQFTAFTDTRESSRLCVPEGTNGIRCGQPTGVSIPLFFMGEASGVASAWQTGGAVGEPVALVLIGHAGDARQWLCTAATQAQCASAFVVDRVAWVEGHDVPVEAPQTGDQQTGAAITPRMTLPAVAALIGAGDALVTGAPFRAGDIATIDPRWNRAGDGVVWLVRSLGTASGSGASGSGAAATRPGTVWLVDDGAGAVIDRHPLRLAADFAPARLWQMATAHGIECCAGDVAAFSRVTSGDGTVAYEGVVPGGASGGTDLTTFGGGYMSGPLVLPAGGYTVTAWLAGNVHGVSGPPSGECSTRITLGPLDDVVLNADFQLDGACTFGPAPSPSPQP